MRRPIGYICNLVVFIYLVCCPFTKVEESFSMQAIHDLLHNDRNISQYDHLEFPGVVPRSFIGPLIVAGFSWPLVYLRSILQWNKFLDQYICRFILGMFVMFSFSHFNWNVSKRFGKGISKWMFLLTMVQFHFNFYATRSLPNTFALVGALLACSFWLSANNTTFVWISAFTVLIFRAELVILVSMLLLLDLINGRISLRKAFVHALASGILAICFTILIDSIFWRRWLWPEFEVLWFNTILNKSSEWGTQPYFWYFYSALPRMLGPAMILIPFGCYINRKILPLVLVAVVFILIYSTLPHKELRFIIYTVPLLNVAAATSCRKMFSFRKEKRFGWCVYTASSLLLLLTFACSLVFLYASMHNYPGGEALLKLQQMRPRAKNVHVHIDVFSAQTGITRFLQIRSDWRFNKTENPEESPKKMPMSYTHILAGDRSNSALSLRTFANYSKTHRVIAKIPSFHSVKFSKEFPFFWIDLKTSIFIFEKIGWK